MNLSPLSSAFQVNKLSHLYTVIVKLDYRLSSAGAIHGGVFGSLFNDCLSASLKCSVAVTKKVHISRTLLLVPGHSDIIPGQKKEVVICH